jgi:23S rRNA pseudouridine955/2504/2580 synthase
VTAGPKRAAFELEIGRAEAGVRLDRLLRNLLPHVPLSAIHRMIREGHVLRGRARGRVKASDRFEPGDALTLLVRPADAEALRRRLAAPTHGKALRRAIELPVLHRDEHVIAFDKPAGVAAHPGSGHPLERTVLGALYAASPPGPRFRPALVGRLDRDTSGVELGGVSPEGLRGLWELARSGATGKAYLALVRGTDLAEEGRIDSPLLDTGRGRARMRVVPPGTEGALDAATTYRVLARGGGASLVEVAPLTGRRHQIRSHLASVDAPLAGDVRYGERPWNRELAARGLERLFLHCARVSFPHPVISRETRIRCPLPDELVRALDALGIPRGRYAGASADARR